MNFKSKAKLTVLNDVNDATLCVVVTHCHNIRKVALRMIKFTFLLDRFLASSVPKLFKTQANY